MDTDLKRRLLEAMIATVREHRDELTDLDRANEVRRLLRQKYPQEHHAYCDVWALWKMKLLHPG